MDLTCALSILVLIVGVACTKPSGHSSYGEECHIWENVTHRLENELSVHMRCEKNTQCTGFDCTGLYRYQGYFAREMLEIDFCFGIAIHPCKKPVDMNFYIDVPQTKSHYQATISNSTVIKIPELHFNMGRLGTADGYVTVYMEHTLIHGYRYIKIGVTLAVRVQGPVARLGTWPQELRRTLMPNMSIAVPPCKPNIVTPAHILSTCIKYTTTKLATGTTAPTTVATTRYPETGCKVAVYGSCPSLQMCVTRKVGQNLGRCMCLPGFVKDIHNQCIIEGWSTTVVQIIEDNPWEPIQPHKKSGVPTSTSIIIGSCAAVLVTMVIIAGVMFYVYRRHQRRYGNHQLLINNDDDEPIDVST